MRRNHLLFVCKKRQSYGGQEFSSGLRNSVQFIVWLLEGLGVDAHMVEVTDNNDIDREVARYDPTHVIIEALWVVPEKFEVLRLLHPQVKWIVRIHSEVPFIASEGIALEWMMGYWRQGVEVAFNSARARRDLRIVAHTAHVDESLLTYLPNYYPEIGAEVAPPAPCGILHVGCFGAVRPLKNHLTQAIAALAFASNMRVPLAFHINNERVEDRGDPMLRNLRALFAGACGHAQLVEHPWLPHYEFLLLMKQMNVALQVSLSETFNIVSADAVACSIPVIASPEVPWLGDYAKASPHDAQSIVEALHRLFHEPMRPRLFMQRRDLNRFVASSMEVWRERFA